MVGGGEAACTVRPAPECYDGGVPGPTRHNPANPARSGRKQRSRVVACAVGFPVQIIPRDSQTRCPHTFRLHPPIEDAPATVIVHRGLLRSIKEETAKKNSFDSDKGDTALAKILVVGSLNMDLVGIAPRIPVVGETIIGNTYFTEPGGKGANQAYAAALLGGEVAMLGRIGDDDFGQQMRTNLEHAGCDASGLGVRTRHKRRRSDICGRKRPELDHCGSRRQQYLHP